MDSLRSVVCVYLWCSLILCNFIHVAIALKEARGDPSSKDYNILLSEIRLNFVTGIELIWDSNYNRNNSNEELSFAVSPTLLVDMYWPISPTLELSTAVNLGYDFYLEGEGEDGFTVSGTDTTVSYLDLDLYLGENAMLTASNAFSANIASASIQTNTAERRDASYRRFENATSLRYAQLMTPYTRVNAAYTFSQTFSESAVLANPDDYQQHALLSGFSTQLNEALTVSLLTSLSMYLYDDDFRNDINQYRLGSEFSYTSVAGLTSRLHLAFDLLDVDSSRNSGITDDQSTSLYVDGSMSFHTGPFMAHRFRLGYRNQISQATTADPANPGSSLPVNFEQVINLDYQFNYLIHENLTLRLSHQLSRTQEAEDGNEYYEQEIQFEPRLKLEGSWTVYARYTYTNVFESKFATFDYQRHQIATGFSFDF